MRISGFTIESMAYRVSRSSLKKQTSRPIERLDARSLQLALNRPLPGVQTISPSTDGYGVEIYVTRVGRERTPGGHAAFVVVSGGEKLYFNPNDCKGYMSFYANGDDGLAGVPKSKRPLLNRKYALNEHRAISRGSCYGISEMLTAAFEDHLCRVGATHKAGPEHIRLALLDFTRYLQEVSIEKLCEHYGKAIDL